MIRWSVLVAGTALAFAGGAAVPARDEKAPAETAKAPIVVGQRTGYFNMAKVMREFKRAKTMVDRLNAEKNRLSASLLVRRAKRAEIQTKLRTASDGEGKEKLEQELVAVARKIEDEEKEITKRLNDKAGVIIGELYDEMRAVVAALAREQGLAAVLTYPDGVTEQELGSPYVKEMKLKPPAAQPFYLDPSVDYTDEIIRRLNEKFDAESKD